MRRALVIVSFLIVLGLLANRLGDQIPIPQEIKTASTPVQPPRQVSPQKSTAAAKRLFQRRTAPTMSSVEARNEPTKLVAFVVHEGLAVAFDDIILGTPDEESLSSGYYELPLPQYWDRAEIPYAINGDVEHPDQVSAALRHIEEKTALRFIPYENQPDALIFQKGAEHCESTLGRLGGLQPIRLAARCQRNEVVHEVLHALGFIHEQSRADRDPYVEVVWDNIEEKFWPQFQKLPLDFQGPAKNSTFDYHSIMMYEPTTFGKERGALTLKTKTSIPIQPSQNGLSPEDIRRIKVLFRLD